MDPIVAITALAALVFYFATGLNVARARGATGIAAPAMTGDPRLERAVRVQMNTLEWLPTFLVTLGLFAAFVPRPYGPWAAVALGVLWIIGRILYLRGYMADPSKRGPGFAIQSACCAALLLGALGGALGAMLHGG